MSLLINIGSVWAFQTYLKQLQPLPSVFEPLAVEFIDIPVEVGETRQTLSKGAIASTSSPTKPTNQASTITDPEAYEQNDEIFVKQTPSKQNQTSNKASSSAITKSDPPQSRPITPPNGPSSNLSQSQFASSSGGGINPDINLDESETLTESSPQDEGPVTSGVALPPVPDVPKSNDSIQNPLEDSSTISRNSLPPIVSARVKVNSYQRDVSTTLSTELPVPFIAEGSEDSTRTFASHELGCSFSPDSLRSFGQPVTVEISLNEQGKLEGETATTVQSSSGNDSYNDLAICVLKQWHFNVASSSNRSPGKTISRRLEVDVTLMR